MTRYEIEYPKKIPKGYIGDNMFAAKAHNIPWKHKHPEHIIEIKKSLPRRIKLNTEHHEEFEEWEMKSLEEKKHYSPKRAYHKAHYDALRFEKQHKPFPSTNEKYKLKQMGFKI